MTAWSNNISVLVLHINSPVVHRPRTSHLPMALMWHRQFWANFYSSLNIRPKLWYCSSRSNIYNC